MPSGGYDSGETFILHLGGGDVKLLAHMSFLHLNVYGWIAHFLFNCNRLRNQGWQKCFQTVDHPLSTLARAPLQVRGTHLGHWGNLVFAAFITLRVLCLPFLAIVSSGLYSLKKP